MHRYLDEGPVGGEGFAVDARLIKADANRQRDVPGTDGQTSLSPARAVQDYIAVLDDAAFGGASKVTPKFFSPADPAARWTGAHGDKDHDRTNVGTLRTGTRTAGCRYRLRFREDAVLVGA